MLMFRSSRSARRRFLRTGVYSGRPRFTLKSTFAWRCCTSSLVDEFAVDVVAQDGFHIVAIGLNAETGRRIAGQARRRDDLVGLDEANCASCHRDRRRIARTLRRRGRGGGRFLAGAAANGFRG